MYHQYRDTLKTGDVVLFSGKGQISQGIKLLTFSEWSHVGLVLRLPDIDSVFLWESTTLTDIPDAIDGKAKRGVQLVLLSDRLNNYDGRVAVRTLMYEPGFTTEAEVQQGLLDFRREVRNRPYEESYIELLKSALDGPFSRENKEDLSSLFCSELVVAAFKRQAIVIGDKPSNEYTPADIAHDRGMSWNPQCWLGPLMDLKEKEA